MDLGQRVKDLDSVSDVTSSSSVSVSWSLNGNAMSRRGSCGGPHTHATDCRGETTSWDPVATAVSKRSNRASRREITTDYMDTKFEYCSKALNTDTKCA